MTLLRLRKEWKSVMIWLLLPIILTIVIVKGLGEFQQNAKVPIALIVEDESVLAAELAASIAEMELLSVHDMDLDEALFRLKQHELDSVFVIKEGYGERIHSNQRNRLIEAYSSNRSFAYPSLSETVMSLAQQDISRAKAAYVIQQIFHEFDMDHKWDYNRIIDASIERQRTESLLHTSFTFEKGAVKQQTVPFLNVWGIWALFAIISAFFLFDWMIKESRPSIKVRWLYAATSFQAYSVRLLAIYTLMTLVADGLALLMFAQILETNVTVRFVLSLLVFRTTLNLFSFLLAILFERQIMYYVTGMAVSIMLTIAGGGILPMERLAGKWPWIEMISPVRSLMTNSMPVIWLFPLAVLLVGWIWRGGKRIA
ncbi:ABC transporter permease [Sporosarcina sp. Te-1]|uniref:ABC transporter permease n=1 Tax=Sporosarcina sp. Te-1 TaxID=2818390 RepID=UPI001A9CBCCC|nr:ABC transporter permease [Sporosarcina sp. Te-1]QTD41300.1 ABC transporter permease [Sporosarcina sp. Te-1]